MDDPCIQLTCPLVLVSFSISVSHCLFGWLEPVGGVIGTYINIYIRMQRWISTFLLPPTIHLFLASLVTNNLPAPVSIFIDFNN